MASGDKYEAVIRYNCKGEKMVNVIHYIQIGGDGAGLGVVAMCGAMHNALTNFIKACLSNDCTIIGYSARRIAPTQSGRYDQDVNVAGTVASDVTSTQLSICLNFFTASVGPKFRGRMHIPGVPDSSNQDGILPATATANYQFLAAAMIGDITTAGADWTFHAGIWDASGPTFSSFNHSRTIPRIRALRGRRMANP